MNPLQARNEHVLLLEKHFAEDLALLEDIRQMTHDLGRHLEIFQNRERFLRTAVQFAIATAEAPESIMRLVESGHLTHCYILLRWFLEMWWRLTYLWKKPDEYERWLKEDKQIRPEAARKLCEEQGWNPWKEAYKDWCNAVHCNSSVMEYYDRVWSPRPPTDDIVYPIGNILINLVCSTYRMNCLLLEILEPHMGKEYDLIADRREQLARRIMSRRDQWAVKEQAWMQSSPNETTKDDAQRQ